VTHCQTRLDLAIIPRGSILPPHRTWQVRRAASRPQRVLLLKAARAAFPDFHDTVEVPIAESDEVVARLTYRGRHRGELFDIAPTGRQVVYTGSGIRMRRQDV
jgi:hypothetical protein